MQKRLYRIPKVEKPENARCSEPKFNIAEAALERLLKQEKTAQTARKMLTDFQSEINKVL
ncbi:MULTISPECIES: hypothetical protein [Mediterraneibacter]|uniref:hypothetical protein n=1 Tax=Mediterraneibacter TaxID=2316020 RepID=UPI001D0241A0|nr:MULTISPECIES: hypothetical protein [Mediterraneibacter]MCB5561752.1 hypothetical protein [Mediterraneibacter faecis]MCB5567213.1 hypothetical protein [Mediterraneibacter faecis]MCB5578731.1 hypothetical protein [Mediterraneibacter faecis]MCB5585389.1 hypothetical protein [Mediterraneibacter faecis]MCI7723012.1 hypothetical protein [Mediterraneibacter faecis]